MVTPWILPPVIATLSTCSLGCGIVAAGGQSARVWDGSFDEIPDLSAERLGLLLEDVADEAGGTLVGLLQRGARMTTW